MLNLWLLHTKGETLGMTQTQAAKRAGFKYVSQWNCIETGQRGGHIRMKTLAMLAKAIGEDPTDLLMRNPTLLYGELRARPHQLGYIPELDHAFLQSLRMAANLTAKQAALRAGIYPNEWSALESSSRPSVTLSMLSNLASALEVNPRDLLRMPP